MNELASLYPCAAILSPSILTYLPILSPFAGDIGTLVLPAGMQNLNLHYCKGLTGDIGTLVLPEGMQDLYLTRCSGLTGTLPTSEKAKLETYYPPPSEEKAAAGTEEEEALRAFAESVGMPVERMWEGETRGDGGEIVEIDWESKDLKGTLPVGDMHMPYLRELDLHGNRELKGEARGVRL